MKRIIPETWILVWLKYLFLLNSRRVWEIERLPWYCLPYHSDICYHITNTTRARTRPASLTLTTLAHMTRQHATYTTHASSYSTTFLKLLKKVVMNNRFMERLTKRGSSIEPWGGPAGFFWSKIVVNLWCAVTWKIANRRCLLFYK